MREKENFNIAAIVCAAISLLLLVFPVSGLVHSARAVITYSFYPSIYAGSRAKTFLRGVPDNFRRLFETDKLNRQLEEKISAMEIELESLRAANSEADRLRAALALTRQSKWKGTWARVSGRDARNWYGFLTIDKGLDDGIQINDTVMAVRDGSASIVGRVYEAYPHFSRVMLAGNKAFSIIVSIGQGGTDVLAEGTGEYGMKIEYMPVSITAEEGTEVFSAPSATLYVPNARLGRLSKIYKRDSEVSFSSAEISLHADLDSLKELYVVRHNLPSDLIPPTEEAER